MDKSYEEKSSLRGVYRESVVVEADNEDKMKQGLELHTDHLLEV